MHMGQNMTNNWQHGSSRWARTDDLEKENYLDNGGIPLGYFLLGENKHWRHIGYTGDQHMLTVAPTRSGKGTCAIIPTLLEHLGGVLCIDPKGENAIITAQARENNHGQEVHILDPWGLACDVIDKEAARFNPLDMLKADSPDLVDDALMIADALIVSDQMDSHWSNEARAMIMGFILYLVISPNEKGQRTLGRLRDILSMSPADFMVIVNRMKDMTDYPNVMNAGNRITQKSERELSSVISTAQQNTHFLESRALRESLSETTFDFAKLKDDENPVSVFLVLPAERLNTHGRWLRLMVSMAITAIVRTKGKPRTPALFILDEFAALGKLAVVEQAYGLMAGFGMTIWAILQDLSQLQDLYDRRWQTFIANAGVLQAFGTRDTFTAEYISKLCGIGTHEKISKETAEQRKDGIFFSGDPDYTAMADSTFGRPVIMQEEIMRLPHMVQLIFMPHCYPIEAAKVPYFKNARYFLTDEQGEISPMFNIHPDFEGQTMDFRALDEETKSRFGKIDEARAKQAEKERLERERIEEEERQKRRAEMMEKAAETSKDALKKAGKLARFMGEKLAEGHEKYKRSQDKKEDE